MLIDKKIGRLISQELLFGIYFWGFSLIKPLLKINYSYSTMILFGFTFAILVISIIKSIKSKAIIENYMVVIFMVLIFLIDSLFRSNEYIFKYIYDFIIYGAIPIYILSQVRNVERLLKIFSVLSIISFILYGLDGLNNYAFFENYMTFGFNLLVPAYFGIYVGRKVFNAKWLLIIEILCLFDIILFANRSAILSVALLWIVVTLFYEKNSYRKNLKILLAGIVFCFSIIFIKDIVDFFIIICNKYQIDSYSLVHIKSYLEKGDISALFSGRIEIWNYAQEMIKDKLLIGNGTGAFQQKYTFYTHNLYYDIMVQYGIAGLSIFLLVFSKCMFNIFKVKEYTRLFAIVLFCLWFPKLFLSSYLFRDIAFWSFLAFGFMCVKIKSIKDIGEKNESISRKL